MTAPALTSPPTRQEREHQQLIAFHEERLQMRLRHITFTLWPYYQRYGLWPDRDPVLITGAPQRQRRGARK
jgi:hypothetical protein